MPRVGRKRADRRWISPDGQEWDSKFEWQVWQGLVENGYKVRRCDERDRFAYRDRIAQAECGSCGSSECFKARTYTPDLFLYSSGRTRKTGSPAGFYVEIKGYFSPQKRRLFRCFTKDRPDVDVRFILYGNPYTKRGGLRLTEYFDRYLKAVPYHVWNGNIPQEWLE